MAITSRYPNPSFLFLNVLSTSLVAQWLRIRLPMQGHGFEPWSGKIPHAAEQLSPCATTTEPALQSPRATTTEARTPRAPAPQQEKPPLAAARESPRAATKTQRSHK